MTDVYHTRICIYHAAGTFPVERGVIHFDRCKVLVQSANLLAIVR